MHFNYGQVKSSMLYPKKQTTFVNKKDKEFKNVNNRDKKFEVSPSHFGDMNDSQIFAKFLS